MNAGNVGGGEDEGLDDLTQDELFEEKLRETIDMATQKSANGKKYRFDITVVGSRIRPSLVGSFTNLHYTHSHIHI